MRQNKNTYNNFNNNTKELVNGDKRATRKKESKNYDSTEIPKKL